MAYYDYTTTNKSFLDMYLYLKSINVKNNNFMLILFDKELLGVDPYDPNLPDYIKRKIIKECKENIFYFLREVIRIPKPKQGGECCRYELNRANCSQLFCFINNHINWLSAPKFLGKTTSTECILVWTDLFCYDNNIKILAYNRNNSKYILHKINNLKLYLPDYIKEISNQNTIKSSFVPPIDKDKISEYCIEEYYNCNIIYYNDSEYIKSIKDIFDSSLNLFLNLKMKNFINKRKRKFCILFESVYSDNADENGALDIINSCIKWSEDFYDTINNIDKESMIYIEYHYYELGKDDEWYKYMCRILNNDEKIINRELLLKRN